MKFEPIQLGDERRTGGRLIPETDFDRKWLNEMFDLRPNLEGIMPEWQGAGIGTRFLDAIGQYHLEGRGRCGHKFPMFFHTSHPQLCAALRRSNKWVQTNSQLFGANKVKSAININRSREKSGKTFTSRGRTGKGCTSGYGGHFRAVQSFKYLGVNN